MADPATDAMAAEAPMTADPTLRALSTPRPDTSRDDALIRDVKESQARSDEIRQRGISEMRPFVRSYIQEAMGPHPAIPQPERVPEMQTQQGGSAVEGFMMAVLPMAALASAHGRNASTTMLAAMTGALTGIHQGNREAFEQNFKVLKENKDSIIKNNELLQQQYMNILNDKKLSEAEKLSTIHLVAEVNHDELTAEQARTGNFIQIAQLLDKRDQGSALLAERWARVEKMEKEARQQSDQTIDTYAKAVAEYRVPPPNSYRLSTPQGQAIMAKVMELNPEYTAETYGQRNTAEKAFGTGKLGYTVRSFNVAISHLDVMQQLSDALAAKDVNALNRARNAFKQQFGYEAPTNFDAAKGIVGDEIVKAVVGSRGALGDREEAKAALDRSRSPDQLKGVINTYKRLMQGQLTGLRQQYEFSTGKKNFDEMLSPGTKGQIGGGGQSGGPEPQQGAPQDGATATNPQTGQKIILRGGQWVPMQ